MKNSYSIFRKIRKTVLLLSMAGLILYCGKPQAQNVGITDAGSITPNYILQLHKATNGIMFQLTNSNTSTGLGDGFIIDIDAALKVMFKNQEAGTMAFFTNGTERVTILSGGNVGVGDASPSALFTVGNTDLFQILSTGEARGIAGTAAVPSFSFTGNTSTGMYCSAASEISFSTAGTQRMAVLAGGGLQVNSVSGSATVNPSNNSLITADNSGIIGKYMASLPPSGTLELWYRPVGMPYIQPLSNSNIRVYDILPIQPYGIYYDGNDNAVGGYFRTTSAVAGTTAVQGFSDVSGQQQYGYLGYNGSITMGGSTINGASVYGWTNDPNSTGVYGRTTGTATVAAVLGYSDKWIPGYFYGDQNADPTYPRPALYGQMNCSIDAYGSQIGVQAWSEKTAGTNNYGYTIGLSATAKSVYQDARAVSAGLYGTNTYALLGASDIINKRTYGIYASGDTRIPFFFDDFETDKGWTYVPGSGTANRGAITADCAANACITVNYAWSGSNVANLKCCGISQIAYMYKAFTFPAAGSVSFNFFGGSEATFDKFCYKIDAVPTVAAPGTTIVTGCYGTGWYTITISGITIGAHTIYLSFGTDGSTNSNGSKWCIDDFSANITSTGYAAYFAGNGCYTGTWGVCSDIRYKKDLTDFDSPLKNLLNLKGTYFYWDRDAYPDLNFAEGRQIGLIAQNVEKYFPEVVNSDENGYKNVDYSKLSPVIIEAMREQQNEIDSLLALTKKLIEEINKIETMLGMKNNLNVSDFIFNNETVISNDVNESNTNIETNLLKVTITPVSFENKPMIYWDNSPTMQKK
ncbi:MAG: tail fiber domain-containing protein [Bacteroidota bacterium]